MLQQRIGGAALGAFPAPVDLIGFGNAQLQTFPTSFIAAPAPFGRAPIPAGLMSQLSAERDQTAAALARAMHMSPDEGNGEQNPTAPPAAPN